MQELTSSHNHSYLSVVNFGTPYMLIFLFQSTYNLTSDIQERGFKIFIVFSVANFLGTTRELATKKTFIFIFVCCP